MKKSFVLAGVMFGVYMVLAALLTWVNFSPLLNTLKAILITIMRCPRCPPTSIRQYRGVR